MFEPSQFQATLYAQHNLRHIREVLGLATLSAATRPPQHELSTNLLNACWESEHLV